MKKPTIKFTELLIGNIIAFPCVKLPPLTTFKKVSTGATKGKQNPSPQAVRPEEKAARAKKDSSVEHRKSRANKATRGQERVSSAKKATRGTKRTPVTSSRYSCEPCPALKKRPYRCFAAFHS